jgi:dTDP-6-deoxy-L-talose 4-dehydrogenase (NAD+)
MKIAVTGATGFLGRHVLRELAARGIETVAVARTPSPPATDAPRTEWVYMDVAQSPVDAFDRLGRPDVLIHLAWGGLPNYRSPHHFEVELPAQYRFLKSLVEAGLSDLLVTGTCFEYGMQSGPLHEGLDARPTNPYGFAKDSLRRQLQYLQTVRPFNLAWARLFYLFGEGQAENSLLPQLQRAVARGDAAFDMSGGEQLRDYLPAGEAARHLVTLAEQRADLGVVNVCSGRPVSVRGLVERWIRDNGWPIALNLGRYPYPDYEPMAFWGDRTRLDGLLALT